MSRRHRHADTAEVSPAVVPFPAADRYAGGREQRVAGVVGERSTTLMCDGDAEQMGVACAVVEPFPRRELSVRRQDDAGGIGTVAPGQVMQIDFAAGKAG